MLEQMARDHFIDAIRDPSIQFMVQYKEPETLDQAVLTAIKVNARARNTTGDEAKSGKKVSFCRAVKSINHDNESEAGTSATDLDAMSDMQEQIRLLTRQVNASAKIQCYFCKESGHIRRFCPHKKPDANQKN